MASKTRALLFDADAMRNLLQSMASRILESHPDLPIILIGIERRGVPLARRLAEIMTSRGVRVDVGTLDINLYRDDLTMVASQPIVRKTDQPRDINGRDVVLVDDVLYTGRTVRAALEALNDYGRARRIQLAVVIDRGLRELPIQPDFVGRCLETTGDEIVHVRVSEIDGEDGGWMETEST